VFLRLAWRVIAVEGVKRVAGGERQCDVSDGRRGSLRSNGQHNILGLHEVLAYKERVHTGVSVVSGTLFFETNYGTKTIWVDGRLQSRVSSSLVTSRRSALGFPTSP